MAVISTGQTALEIAEKSSPALKAAYFAALEAAQNNLQVSKISAFIVAGDLMGLNAYLSANLAAALAGSGVIETLDRIAAASGQAAAADINAYAAKHPGEFAVASQYPFATTTGFVGDVLIATATPEFTFNTANPKTIAALKSWEGALIQEMNLQMRRSVLDQVTEGVMAGTNPRQIATEIKSNIGLTAYQQNAVKNFGKDLDRIAAGQIRSAQSWGLYTPKQIAALKESDPRLYKSLQFTDREKAQGRRTAKISRATGPGSPSVYRIFPDGDPKDGMTSWRLRDKRFDSRVYAVVSANENLAAARALGPANAKGIAKAEAALDAAMADLSPAKRAEMVAAYKSRYLSFRATTIARTEALHAANLGQYEAFRQMVQDSDLIGTKQVTKKWVTAHDDRVRLDHRAVVKTPIPFDALFNVDGVQVQHPPHNPNCRCVCAYGFNLTA